MSQRVLELVNDLIKADPENNVAAIGEIYLSGGKTCFRNESMALSRLRAEINFVKTRDTPSPIGSPPCRRHYMIQALNFCKVAYKWCCDNYGADQNAGFNAARALEITEKKFVSLGTSGVEGWAINTTDGVSYLNAEDSSILTIFAKTSGSRCIWTSSSLDSLPSSWMKK